MRSSRDFVSKYPPCRPPFYRGNDDESFDCSSRGGMFLGERDGAGAFAAESGPQAAASGEAKGGRRLQASRSGQGDQGLGRQLRDSVRASRNRTHGRALCTCADS
jgi:hypothetical protein